MYTANMKLIGTKKGVRERARSFPRNGVAMEELKMGKKDVPFVLWSRL
jgi:hypothetical protein